MTGLNDNATKGPRPLPPGGLLVDRVAGPTQDATRGTIVTYLCTHLVDKTKWRVNRAETSPSGRIGNQLALDFTIDQVEYEGPAEIAT